MDPTDDPRAVEYAWFLEHHSSCETCRRSLKEPPDFSGGLALLLADLSSCTEGLSRARACVTVPFDPGLMVVLPFVAALEPAGGPSPRFAPVVKVPAGVGVIDLQTRGVPWAAFRLVGFRARIYRENTDANEAEARRLLGVEDIVLVTDLQIGGSINLLWHEDFSDLRAYEDGRPLVRLRANPILRAPNQASVTLARPAGSSEDIYVACELVVEPVSDDNQTAAFYGAEEIRSRLMGAVDSLLKGIGGAVEQLGGLEPDTDFEESPDASD